MMSWVGMVLEDYFSGKWLGTVNTLSVFLLLLATSVLFIRWLSKPKMNLPKGPTGLPFVGYFPLLGKEPYKTLNSLKDKYGNIFRVKMGPKNVIILADYQAVEEVLGKIEAANRPPGLFDFLPDSFGICSDSGEKWAQHRRFAIRTMRELGLGKTTWTMLVEEELDEFLKQIASKNGQPMDIARLLSESISNNIISMVFGKRLQPGEHMDMLIDSAAAIAEFFGQCSLWLYFPWLCKILAKVKGNSYYSTLQRLKTFNKFFRDEVDLHRKHRSDVKGDYMAEYLQTMEGNTSTEKKAYFTEKDMIGDAQVFFTGGSDTLRASLNWLFLAMAAYPDVQEKVHAEVESVLGKQKMVSWEDRLKFPYAYSVILEGQRFWTIVPLNTSRMAGADFKVFGYDIPKGSNIIANYWALHNDPRYWTEPEIFNPDRFLRDDGKVDSKPKSYFPFSYGKRKCPGEMVAMMELFLYFVAVIQKFHIRMPNGRKANLDGTLGLLYVPEPQELCFAPRL